MNRLFLLLFGAVSLVAHAQVPDYVPTEGLVAWYPLDGDAVDQSSNALNGTLNGPTLDEDRFGLQGALYFDGTDDYILIPHDEQLSFGNNSMTVSMWVRIDALPNGINEFQTLMKVNGWSSSTVGYQSVISGTGVTLLRAKNGFTTTWMETGTAVSWDFGSYTHITYSLTDTLCSTFINGELASFTVPSNTVIGTNDQPLIIGWNNQLANTGYSFAFTGNMDDVGFWNRALTEEEVLALFLNSWPVEGCTDPTACNFDAEATSDDGSCIPSGCMEPEACNYNALAECAGEACDHTCCPGPGCCSAGMYWDYDLEQCMNYETCQDDLDGDGVIGVNDLMQLLSSFGTDCAPAEDPETAEWTCGDPVSYQGYDYATVQIGEQCWFAENLRTELYQNGDSIPGDLSDEEWSDMSDGAQAIYDNDSINLVHYGRLYNGFAALDNRNLCPNLWKVPTSSEYEAFLEFLGGNLVAGNAMKESPMAVIPWDGSNSSGFTGLPAGKRDAVNGLGYYQLGYSLRLWTSTSSIVVDLASNTNGVSVNSRELRVGGSIRCIKD